MIRLLAPITKIDVQRRLVIGRLAQEIPDRAKEILDYASSKPYFKAWSEGFAKATANTGQEVSFGNLRAMHGKVAAGKFTRVEFNDEDMAIDVIAKVVDDQEWKKCEEGVYTAFSIGGDYVGEKRAEKVNGVTHMRYTANPGEGSLVDSPCIPTAKFFEIVKADGTTFQKAFAVPEEKPLSIEQQNARVEKVAKRLARAEFWKQSPGLRAQLPEDIFEKMSADDKLKMLSKRPPDENWQAHVLEAIRIIKASDYNDDEDNLEKPAAIDQEDWDDMDYEEKLEAVDEYEKVAVAAVQKADDEKGLAKPVDVEQEKWDDLTPDGKKKEIAASTSRATEKAAAAALNKAEQDEMATGAADTAALEKAAAIAREEELAIAAGATPTTLNAVDELTQLLNNGAVSVEKLLSLAKGETTAAAGGNTTTTGAPAAGNRVVSKEADVTAKKNLYNVQSFARALQALAGVCASAQWDMTTEGDDSPIPQQLRGWIASGTKIFCDMAEEEANELVEGLQRSSPTAPYISETLALSSLATMHKVDTLRRQLEDPDIKLSDFHKIAVGAVGGEEWKHGGYFQKYIEDRTQCIEDILAKAGARHSAEDKEHLQQAHDHLCKLGAACSKDHLPAGEAEKLTGSGDLFKLALQSAEQIAALRDELGVTKAEVVKLRDQPVRPRGVIRAIAKGGDAPEVLAAAARREADALQKAAETAAQPKEGEHNPDRAIALVREQVRKTTAFRNLG